MPKFCNRCGNPVSENEKFCQNCGAPVNNAPQAYPRNAYPQNGADSRMPQPQPQQNAYPANGINPYSAQPSQNAVPRQQTKRSGAFKKILCLILALIFVAEIMAVSSGKKPRTGNDPADNPSAPASYDSHYEGGETLIGCSKAFSKEVENGVTLSAEENALYKDTEISVTPLTQADDAFIELNDKFRNCGEYIFDAWDIDAGLEPDEHLPGEYEMKLDLKAFDIPENLYEQVNFYRIASDGRIFEYETELEGSSVSFRSHQNSIAVVAIATTAAGIVITKRIVEYVAEDYFRSKPGESPCSIDVGTYSRRCHLTWYASDVDPDFAEKTKRMDEIRETVRKQTEENLLYESSNILNIFRTNSAVAAEVDRALAKNEEYTKLQNSLKLSPFIERFKKMLGTAYSYLDSVEKVKMPTYRVNFYLKAGLDALGFQVTNNMIKSYVEIGVNDNLIHETENYEKEWDNLLLTVTHELFHICQERYHTSYFTQVKSFDEMTAVVLESDARDYYTENRYITTRPDITNEKDAFWDTMHYSVDDIDINSEKKDDDDPNQEHGYALSRFVMFLRKKTGKTVTAKQLMNERKYFFKTDISGPLKKCFDLSDAALENYLKAFVTEKDENGSNRDNLYKGLAQNHYYSVEKVSLPNGGSVHAVPSYAGPLSINAHWIVLEKRTPCAVLMVPDKNFAEKNPGVMLVPTSSFKRFSQGAFIEAQGDTINLGMILEVCGNTVPSKSEAGYTLYAVSAPAAPVCTVNEKELRLTLPEADSVYADGYANGFKAVFSFKNYEPVVKDIKAEYFGSETAVPLNQIAPEGVRGKADFTVKYVPYITDGDETLLGPESKTASVTAQFEEEPVKNENNLLTGSTNKAYIKQYSCSGFEIRQFTAQDLEGMNDNSYQVFDYTGKPVSFSFDGEHVVITIPQSEPLDKTGRRSGDYYKANAIPGFTVTANFSESKIWAERREYWDIAGACRAQLSPFSILGEMHYGMSYGEDNVIGFENKIEVINPDGQNSESLDCNEITFSYDEDTGEFSLLIHLTAHSQCFWNNELETDKPLDLLMYQICGTIHPDANGRFSD